MCWAGWDQYPLISAGGVDREHYQKPYASQRKQGRRQDQPLIIEECYEMLK